MRIAYTNAEQTFGHIDLDDGRILSGPLPPRDAEARAIFEAAVAGGAVIAPFAPPTPAEGEVEAEYRRRLFELLEARDMAHAAFIRADNEAELRELVAKPTPSPDDTARIAELRAISVAVSGLIEAYNAVPIPPPSNFTDDAHWG